MILLNSITVDSDFIIYAVLALIALFIYFFYKNSDLRDRANKNNITVVQRDGQLREKDLFIEKIQSEVKANAQDMATVMLEQWKTTELKVYQKIIEEAGLETSRSQLHQWKIDNEQTIRKDARNRSVRVVLGKATENLVPFTESFPFNPRDTRFIGSPIDLIVFDGIEENLNTITIYFIEVKTGTSALSPKQRKIKNAIEEGRVRWELISLKDFGDAVNEELNNNNL